MKTLIAGGFLLVTLAMPAFANHDQGQGNSQDHLHRAVVQVPEPSSGILLSLGAALIGGGAALRAFGRRKRTSADTRRTERT